MRKLWFAHLARAIVCFPGGYGTLDEMFELLTLAQTGKLDRRQVILLYGPEFWNEVLDFRALARHGMIAEADLDRFQVVDSPQAALAALREKLAPAPEESATPAVARSVDADRRRGAGA